MFDAKVVEMLPGMVRRKLEQSVPSATSAHISCDAEEIVRQHGGQNKIAKRTRSILSV